MSFSFFFNSPENPINAIHTFLGIGWAPWAWLTYQDLYHWRKMTLPSLEYIYCPQLLGCWSGFKNPFPHQTWSCASNQSFCEFVHAAGCNIQRTSFHSSSPWPPLLTRLLPPLPQWSLSLGEGVRYMSHAELSSPWRSFSALWPAVAFCSNYYPRHKEMPPCVWQLE